MSNLEDRASDLTPKCKAAMDRGECTLTPCASKAAALRLIREGEADAMVVREPTFWIEIPAQLVHTAIRFDDRALGEAARALSLEGFKDDLEKGDHNRITLC